MLYPILSQFNHVITRGIPEQTALVNYLSAELFRHSATYIHKKNPQASPAHAGIDNYFAGLQEFAVNVIKCKTAPDFLKDQASFLLLIRLDTRLDEKSHTPSHDIIFKLINGHRDIIEVDNTNTENLATYILLANQLKPHNEALLRAVCSILENIQSSIDSEKSFIKLLEFNKKLEQLLLLVAKQNIIFL